MGDVWRGEVVFVVAGREGMYGEVWWEDVAGGLNAWRWWSVLVIDLFVVLIMKVV